MLVTIVLHLIYHLFKLLFCLVNKIAILLNGFRLYNHRIYFIEQWFKYIKLTYLFIIVKILSNEYKWKQIVQIFV